MTPAGAARPAPRAAYGRWLDALGRAGWPGPPGPAEQVPLEDALGRVAAAPVAARWASPRDDCAAMDGIAVRAADLASCPAETPGGTVRLHPGQFRWIDTGDPLPPGADAVVVRERLRRQADGSVLVTPDLHDRDGGDAPGRHVRAAGEDFRAGQVLVPAGRVLRPGDLAAAAGAGHVQLSVRRQPAVAVIPTGDEIRPAGSVSDRGPHRGEIIDTNSVMLAARCRQLGAAAAVSPVIADDPDALARAVRQAAAGADLILVIAGSSRGRDDHAGAVLAQVGGVAVSGVAVRPGHPALLGHAKRAESAADPGGGIVPAIGLPGYPLAAAVAFELFAAPLLAALAGREPGREHVRARLDRDWTAHAGTEDWVLVTLTPADGGLPAASPARRGASSVSLLAGADAWWPVPAGAAVFAAGTEIDVLPIR